MITVTSGNISHINQGWQFPCAVQYYFTNSTVLHSCTDPSFCTFRSRVANKIESYCRLMQKKTLENKRGNIVIVRVILGLVTTHIALVRMLVIRPRPAGIISC